MLQLKQIRGVMAPVQGQPCQVTVTWNWAGHVTTPVLDSETEFFLTYSAHGALCLCFLCGEHWTVYCTVAAETTCFCFPPAPPWPSRPAFPSASHVYFASTWILLRDQASPLALCLADWILASMFQRYKTPPEIMSLGVALGLSARRPNFGCALANPHLAKARFACSLLSYADSDSSLEAA